MNNQTPSDAAAEAVNILQTLTGGGGGDAGSSPAASVTPAESSPPAAPPISSLLPAPAPSPAPAGVAELDSLVQGALSAFNPELVQPATVVPPETTTPAPAEDMTPEALQAVEDEAKRNPQAGHVFAKLRADLKEASKRAEAAEKARAELQAQQEKLGEERARFAKELEEKDKLVVDMEERLGRANLEASPKFRQQYDLRMQESVGKLANSLVKWGKVDQATAAKTAEQLVRSTPEQLDAQLAKVSPAIAGMVMSAWQDVQSIATERQAALQEWKKSTAAQQMAETQSMTQEGIRQRQTLAAKAVAEAADQGCFVYKDVGTPESKAASGQYRDAFAGFVQNASQAELVRKAADGFAAPTLYQVIKLQADRIKQLESGIIARRSVGELPIGSYDPSATPGSVPQQVGPVIKGNSPLERAENAAADAVRRFQMAGAGR